MNRFSFTIGLSLVFVALSPAFADEQAKTIPLDRIWAYEMPGTRDVRELESKLDVHAQGFADKWKHSLVRQLLSYLGTNAPEVGSQAGPAFVVVGSGKHALVSAHDKLVKDKGATRNGCVPANTDLTVVFFSFTTGWHPQISSVEKSPTTIIVKYQFIAPKEPAFGATRFALIPIGTLPAGTVEVKVEQVPPVDFSGRPMPPKKDADRFVCDSFSFDVK
jgi:hypothetical protein